MTHERPDSASREWLTPPSLFEALGLTFDLDPASPAEGPVPWVPARSFIAPPRDGAAEPWEGRVWCNPPFGREAARFVLRMIRHGNGVLLLPARTETKAFQAAGWSAAAVCFLRTRLEFRRLDRALDEAAPALFTEALPERGQPGSQPRAAFGSVLFAWGAESARALITADLGWTVVRP